MTLSRTRLILIAAIAGLAAAAVAAFALQSGGGGGDNDGAAGPLAYQLSVGDVGQAKLNAIEPPASGEPARVAADAAAPADEAPAADPKLQGLLDRKIVQSSSVDLGVEDVGRTFTEIIRIAETARGFVAGSSFANLDDQQVADLTIRVPFTAYQSVLAEIRGMGEVQTEKSDASDVTEEYTDLQARLRTLEATEQRYLELLARAETIPDILTVQDRLDSVRAQIEQVQGRINLLDHVTELATIAVHLRPVGVAEPPADGGPHPLEAAQSAWEASLDAARGLATAALVVGVFSWLLLPPLAAVAIGARWWLTRRPREATL